MATRETTRKNTKEIYRPASPVLTLTSMSAKERVVCTTSWVLIEAGKDIDHVKPLTQRRQVNQRVTCGYAARKRESGR
jgi:hypothetical protein